MRPTSIRETLDRQGVSRPNLRVLTEEDTARLQLPDWTERRRKQRQASAFILVMLIGAAIGIGVVCALARVL